MFLEYVAPYANVNEARSHWRGLLPAALQPVLDQLEPDGRGEALLFTCCSLLNPKLMKRKHWPY
jgi:hypothetical protein